MTKDKTDDTTDRTTARANDLGAWGGRPWVPVVLLVVLGAVAWILFAVSSGSGNGTDLPGSGNGTEEVVLDGLTFQPRSLEIEAGTTVRWVSKDAVLHTVTSGEQGTIGVPGVSEGEPDMPTGLFDQDMPDEGATFTFTFDEPGTYPYYCSIHPGMVGEIVVR